jgi:MYXO-CTERM domain-containing protein
MGAPLDRHAFPSISPRAPRARRRAGQAALSAAALALALLGSRTAAAYDVLAGPCDSDPLTCQRGAISFERIDALPIEFDFDTGWVPQGSPLQVHLWAAVYANTRVTLNGGLETAWPDAFALTTPGDPDGGAFSYHYGLDVGAQGMVNISIGGQTYTWTGDIPYVPQIDFQVEASDQFDAWGWKPGVTIASATDPQQLAQVSIADLIGASIPGIDGGFELDVAMEVAARYQTDRLVLATAEDGAPVSGGEITSANDASSTPYLGGPSVELDVHPEGSVKYDGTLHLIPAFYVDLLGQSWSIPIADIPIGFPLTENEWVFEPKRVHVPLPDLVLPETEINFGEVEVGQKNLESYAILNAGEALLGVTVLSDDPESFEVFDPTLEVEPGATADSAIRFVPKRNGELVAKIFVGSNDPSDPVQVLTVRGTGFGAPEEPEASGSDPSEDGGCACRAAGGPADGGAGAAAAVAGVALALAGRARRRRAR